MVELASDSPPKIGTVFYIIGYKREEPLAPIISSRVYCGRVKKNGIFYHSFVDFLRWWNLTQNHHKIKADDGLLVRNLSDLTGGMKTWDEVLEWVAKKGRNWRKHATLK